MNRFEKNRSRTSLLKNLFSVSVFCLMLVFLLSGITTVSDTASREEAESLHDSIIRSAVQCYALEGFYPETLDYLTENYGITYDTGKYVVAYEAVGANLMPDVTVLLLDGENLP